MLFEQGTFDNIGHQVSEGITAPPGDVEGLIMVGDKYALPPTPTKKTHKGHYSEAEPANGRPENSVIHFTREGKNSVA